MSDFVAPAIAIDSNNLNSSAAVIAFGMQKRFGNDPKRCSSIAKGQKVKSSVNASGSVTSAFRCCFNAAGACSTVGSFLLAKLKIFCCEAANFCLSSRTILLQSIAHPTVESTLLFKAHKSLSVEDASRTAHQYVDLTMPMKLSHNLSTSHFNMCLGRIKPVSIELNIGIRKEKRGQRVQGRRKVVQTIRLESGPSSLYKLYGLPKSIRSP